jgi:RimJ/RimL family protein N-acetyltransferase
MPVADRISFRPLARADLPRLHAWLNAPHARRWFDGGPSFDEVVADFGPQIDGTRPVRSFLVEIDGRDAGWMSWERVADYPAFQNAYRIEDPDAVNCDMLLGEPEVAHRGLGPEVVRAFLPRVVFADPRWTTCVLDPEPDNAIAIRAYEKAGFRFVRAVPDDSEGHAAYLMELRRADLDAPLPREETFVRPARDGEIAIARSIDDDACALYAEAGMPIVADGAFFERETERWARSLRDGRLLFACNAEGEPVAFASFGLLDDRPFLFQLSTRRAWMGRGLGRRLVERVKHWAVRAGSLWLTTYDHLSFNRPFYERVGFLPVGADDGGPELRALVSDETGALPAPDRRIVMKYTHPR